MRRRVELAQKKLQVALSKTPEEFNQIENIQLVFEARELLHGNPPKPDNKR